MKKNNKYKKGFSLPEVLMACAIFAILSTIAIPIYMNYTERTKDIAIETHLKDFSLAVKRYYNANRKYPLLDNTYWRDPWNWEAPKPDDLRILVSYSFTPDENIYLYSYRIMEIQGVEVGFEVKAFYLSEEEKPLSYNVFYYSGYTNNITVETIETGRNPDELYKIGWKYEDVGLFQFPESINWRDSLGSFILNQGWWWQ